MLYMTKFKVGGFHDVILYISYWKLKLNEIDYMELFSSYKYREYIESR